MFGQIEVNDLEKNYLSEIADFDNSTVNREVSVYIPPVEQNNNRWQGLQGDSSYKFRLDTICPGPYSSHTNETPSIVLSFFEFIIHTNSPPVGGNIEVRIGIFLAELNEVKSQIMQIVCSTLQDYPKVAKKVFVQISLKR